MATKLIPARPIKCGAGFFSFFGPQKLESLAQTIFFAIRQVKSKMDGALAVFVEALSIVNANAVFEGSQAIINSKSQLVVIDYGPIFSFVFNNAVNGIVTQDCVNDLF